MTTYNFPTKDDVSQTIGSPIGLLLTLTASETVFTQWASDSRNATSYGLDNKNATSYSSDNKN